VEHLRRLVLLAKVSVKDNTTLYAWYCCLWREHSYRSVGLLPLSMWWMELLLHYTRHNPWNWLDMQTRNYLEVRGKATSNEHNGIEKKNITKFN
jgi:hypothetical protein